MPKDLSPVLQWLAAQPTSLVLRQDLRIFCNNSCGLTRLINKLLEQEALVRISQGAYARTRINRLTGKPTVEVPLETLARLLFKRLGIEVQPSSATQAYNSGKSTQVPAGLEVRTPGRRISRKIQASGRTVRYEKD